MSCSPKTELLCKVQNSINRDKRSPLPHWQAGFFRDMFLLLFGSISESCSCLQTPEYLTRWPGEAWKNPLLWLLWLYDALSLWGWKPRSASVSLDVLVDQMLRMSSELFRSALRNGQLGDPSINNFECLFAYVCACTYEDMGVRVPVNTVTCDCWALGHCHVLPLPGA